MADSKTYYTANSWMGQWNSAQALNIRLNHGDYQKAVQLSLEAERYFDLAKAPEKRLTEQLSRASSLQELSHKDEAESLLKLIIRECEGKNDRNFILGRATYQLGDIELATERYQSAIQHLEQSYDLCISETTPNAQTWTRLAAKKLYGLYSEQIPDNDKAALWKLRTEKLESQTLNQ